MNIAVIGSGISGLLATYKLCGDHDVTLFEANDRLGGHTNTIPLQRDGYTINVDTGFIVFNEHNYPHFTRLLNELWVDHRPTDMSFSVRCDRTGLEYNGGSINGLFAQRSNLFRPRFIRMLRDIARFGTQAAEWRDLADDSTSVEQFVAEHGYSEAFVDDYLVPLGTALWSCPDGTFRSFPMKFVIDFLDNHKMLQMTGRPTWRTVRGGSQRYIDAMMPTIHNCVRLNTPIARIERRFDGVEVTPRNAPPAIFDHVIIACHADQALRLLSDATPLEQRVLGAFPYQANTAVLHTDTSVLPRRRAAWAAWNLHKHAVERDRVAVTYNMNILQNLATDETFCVTLNDDEGIDETKVITRIEYHHPVYTPDRSWAQSQHAQLARDNRTSFCGAYWGFGFHEDGVRSALDACRALTEEPAHA